ncbi:MAG: type III-B CRISPR module RAMP protein Cmr4 [Methanosarcinales archaeon]|uniref:Type III-B CRISPR module RAMP protein Cmr4 n=1 Tax=Candidatus Ethanoperedens thermophilum TaxID=2766897 RepID=A0A848DB49_9EURY|nr:type III-B CRISPR module RAMP protein Cmr4 [Candidatus Ethanoperedens thermophilum]
MIEGDNMRKYDIMFMDVITPLHNGSGEGLGLVDNPILRERTTQFPIIQASSIKGVLRDAYGKDDGSDVVSLFGPPPGKGEEHAGAISFGEGQILAFPVRSLKGCFVWVTSPIVLWRFYQKIDIIGKENLFPELKNLIDKIVSGMDKAMICPSGKDTLLLNGELLLEEFSICCDDDDSGKLLEKFAKEISGKIYRSENDIFLKNEFEKKLVLLNEDTFRYFVTNATEVVPNIKIGEKGTTEKGSLRYTEYLPSETIMYSILTFEKSRRDGANAEGVKNLFADKFPKKTIQIGGDETTGKGVVKLALVEGVKSNDRQKSGP